MSKELSEYYCVDESFLTQMRARFDAWRDSGFNRGDVMILPMLELLNKLPGVATVYSCQGHLAEDSVDRKNKPFQLILAATQEGFIHVMDVYGRVRDRLPHNYPLAATVDRSKKVAWVVRAMDLRMELTLLLKPLSKNSSEYYQGIIITAETAMIDEEERQRFVDQWNRALHEVLRETLALG